ncbi:MAG: hypothetical protein MZV70_21090 [Desulfobacterales bacterium]|nr:hypothetical protein [Desulfobacterales bacterium]
MQGSASASIRSIDELLERDRQREQDGFPRKINVGRLIKPGQERQGESRDRADHGGGKTLARHLLPQRGGDAPRRLRRGRGGRGHRRAARAGGAAAGRRRAGPGRRRRPTRWSPTPTTSAAS